MIKVCFIEACSKAWKVCEDVRSCVATSLVTSHSKETLCATKRAIASKQKTYYFVCLGVSHAKLPLWAILMPTEVARSGNVNHKNANHAFFSGDSQTSDAFLFCGVSIVIKREAQWLSRK